MKLINMKLRNFQGIKSKEFDFDGISRDVRGANGTGKTTIGNAFSWLLTDKPMTGTKGYTPKTVDDKGQEVHNIENAVEATIELEDGTRVTLEKIFKEKWTKRKGAETAEYKGNVTEYKIDGVPSNKTKYNSYLASIMDQDKAQILTNVRYFAEDMPWAKRREILMDVCGDVQDSDVIDANPDLANLQEILRKPNSEALYTVDEYRAIAKETTKGIAKEINSIPSRIDEAEMAKPEMPIAQAEAENIELTIEACENEIQQKRIQINAMKSADSAEAEKKMRIQELKTELSKRKFEYNTEAGKVLEQSQAQKRKLMDEVEKIKLKIQNTKYSILDLERINSQTEKELEVLREQFKAGKKQMHDINTSTWDRGQEVCPTCGQELPKQKVDLLKKEFNAKKSEDLNTIHDKLDRWFNEGKHKNESKKNTQAEIDRLKKVQAELEKAKDDAQAKADGFEMPTARTFESTPESQALVHEIQKLQETPADIESVNQATRLEDELATLKNKYAGLLRARSVIQTIKQQDERIAQLKDQQRTLSKEYQKYESNIYVCDEFIRRKVEMITNKINSIFNSVSFRLFETQVNGGLKECCDVMIPCGDALVPYNDANTASQMNAGIEIISILSEHYKQSLPIFFDNAEGVTHIKAPANMQLIKLTVDDSYKELTMI
jgi:DNA repair exonuclease SbcCD ATPase subunit